MVNQLENLIEKFGVGNQVKVINAHMDIQQVMDSVHATVLLSESASLVKAFPHSLVESLACGKPVLVSEEIAMSDYVKDKSVGLVVDGIDLASLLNQIDLLRSKYEMFRLNAEMVGGKDFSVVCMLEEMGKLYHEIDASI